MTKKTLVVGFLLFVLIGAAVVEAFGTKRADIAAINTFGYMLAHEKYGAEARLTVLRHGLATYQAMFVAKSDSKIKSIDDLAGKKIAFVDPASTSGYLLPLKMLKDKNISPKETVFALSMISKSDVGNLLAICRKRALFSESL